MYTPFLYAIAYGQMEQILREEKPFTSQRKLENLLYLRMLDLFKIDIDEDEDDEDFYPHGRSPFRGH